MRPNGNESVHHYSRWQTGRHPLAAAKHTALQNRSSNDSCLRLPYKAKKHISPSKRADQDLDQGGTSLLGSITMAIECFFKARRSL
jgi:hypothetical protein